jgi:hypothetical protein
MRQAWMGSIALATAVLCGVPRLVQAQEDITVTDKSFGCIRDGTKVRNTYIRNADPQRLAEAVRILRDSVANTEYPVGTFLQLVPSEAMVKHPKAKFPATNGWEFFALELATALPPDPSPPATRIKVRGDKVVNFVGVTCVSCHSPAARYDFVCEKGHGCAPIPIDDKKIAAIQGMDPRCPANKADKP